MTSPSCLRQDFCRRSLPHHFKFGESLDEEGGINEEDTEEGEMFFDDDVVPSGSGDVFTGQSLFDDHMTPKNLEQLQVQIPSENDSHDLALNAEHAAYKSFSEDKGLLMLHQEYATRDDSPDDNKAGVNCIAHGLVCTGGSTGGLKHKQTGLKISPRDIKSKRFKVHPLVVVSDHSKRHINANVEGVTGQIKVKADQVKVKADQVKIKADQVKADQVKIKTDQVKVKADQVKADQVMVKADQVKADQVMVKADQVKVIEDQPKVKDTSMLFDLPNSPLPESSGRTTVNSTDKTVAYQKNNGSSEMKLATIKEHDSRKSSHMKTLIECDNQDYAMDARLDTSGMQHSPVSISTAVYLDQASVRAASEKSEGSSLKQKAENYYMDDKVTVHFDQTLIEEQTDNGHLTSDLSSEALDLEMSAGAAGDKVHFMKQIRPRMRRINTVTGCYPISRNVKTAPSTPECESRQSPPRHAESTSQLEMSYGYGKRNNNGYSSIKGFETTAAELKPHDKKTSAGMKSQNEKFHKLFKNIPENEKVLKSYLCAYVGDILLQGYFYILPGFFCFYTKILGHEKQLEIPVLDVVKITREKTALIIPNAIGIETSKDKYVFGSLMSRDSTFSLMYNVWKRKKHGAPITVLKADDSNSSSEQDFLEAPDDVNSLDESGTHSSASDLSESCINGVLLAEHEADGQCDDQIASRMNFDLTQLSNGVLPNKKTTTASNQNKAWYSSIPVLESCISIICRVNPSSQRTNLFLVACLFISVVLVLITAVMSYKIMLLQSQINLNSQWLDPASSRYVHSQKLYSDLYYLNDRYHTSTIERFHNILEANIQLLSQVHASLFSLQETSNLPKNHKSCSASEDHCHGNS